VVKDGLLAGIVSQGDVVNTLLAHVEAETRHLREYVRLFLGDPSLPPGSRAARRGKGSPGPHGESTGMTASDILRSKGEEVVSVPPVTPILTAMRAMTDHDIGSVLVAGEGRFHGILTERDILRAGAHDPESFHRRQIQELMSRNLIIATPDDSLSAMLSIMARKRIRHLPIVRDGALEGIVSMRDLVAALVRTAEAENKALRDRIQGKSSGIG
jgi:CBS domain-containing protein